MVTDAHPGIVASVIIPTRGGANRLPRLLESLDRQTRRDFEVIVVVDGDVDGTTQVLDEWTSAHPGTTLRSVVFARNRGRAAALNAGHDIARGRVLIRCDDDLEPAPDYVELHIRSHVEDRSGVIGLTSNVYPDTTHARVYGERNDTMHRAEALGLPDGLQWKHWAGNVSVTRSAWELVGRYDEGYRRYGWEDVDYGYRLHVAGVPVRIVADLTTRHHVAATTTAVRAARAFHSGASRELFLRKHGADVLPVPAQERSLWNRLVRVLGHRITEDRVRRWGYVADLAAKRLPRPVAQKIVALLIESAAQGGIEHPERARSRF